MGDLISKRAALDKINERQRKLIYCFGFENDMVKIMDIAKNIIIATPSAQPDNRLSKIAELVEGTIDHFDLDDAMDLLYQIKETVGNETSNI